MTMDQYFIATADPIQNGSPIYGIGKSPGAALTDARDNGAEPRTLTTIECDGGLYEFVEQNGGANIDWVEVDDVATINPDSRACLNDCFGDDDDLDDRVTEHVAQFEADSANIAERVELEAEERYSAAEEAGLQERFDLSQKPAER
jgi:hypothetical protein